MGVVVAGRPRGAYAPLEACACRGHIFKHLMAACLQSGHQLPLDSIFVSRGKSVPLKSICPEWTRYAPCMYMPHTGQQLPQDQPYSEECLGDWRHIEPSWTAHLYPESFNRTFYTQETQKKISHFQEKKGESDKRFITFDGKRKPTRREPKTREAFNFAQRDLIFFENLRNQHLHKLHLGV